MEGRGDGRGREGRGKRSLAPALSPQYFTLEPPLVSPTIRLCLHVVPFLRYSASISKKWRDLETWGRSRSRSLKMARFDRSHTTFYWSPIVGIALCTMLYHFEVI